MPWSKINLHKNYVVYSTFHTTGNNKNICDITYVNQSKTTFTFKKKNSLEQINYSILYLKIEFVYAVVSNKHSSRGNSNVMCKVKIRKLHGQQ